MALNPRDPDIGLSWGLGICIRNKFSMVVLNQGSEDPVLGCCARPHPPSKASTASPPRKLSEQSQGCPPTPSQERGSHGERVLYSGRILGSLGQTKEKATSHLRGFAKS